MLGNWRINHAFGAELIEHALRDLISALIFGHLFTHEVDCLIRAHLLGHGFANGFAHGQAFK